MDSPAAAEVAAALRVLGVDVELQRFAEPVSTAAEAAAALGCEVGAIANSLIFESGGEPLLVLASGAHRVDTKKLARRLGIGKIRRATPDFVVEHTGQRVGGVAPVAHPGPIRTVVDASLAEYSTVWAGAGDENSMFHTSFDELLKLTSGTAAEVT